MDKERRGEIPEEMVETCRSLGCPLVQDQPYPMCQAKVRVDTAKEWVDIGTQIAEDYGHIIPNNCPKEYNKFRVNFRRDKY